MIGKELGNYRVLAPIGKGGMASVFVGEHKLLGNKVAIKLLHKRHLDNKAIERRFFNEAKVIAAIRHPNIVEIFDFGTTDEGAAYIVMELLEGQTLRSRIRRGIMPEHQSVIFMRQLASALAIAHKKGVIHRDLKPDNVFIVADEEVELGERIKLLDFGIAKRIDPEMAEGFPASEQTATGILVGTPAYMSPEQCKGLGNIDGRSDVYSLGVVLYRMLTNQLPFEAGGTGELIGKHLYVEPPSPLEINPDISEGLEKVVMRCLQKEPENRFQTMTDLAAAFDALISGESEFKSRTRRHTASANAVTEIAPARPIHDTPASMSPVPMGAPAIPSEISTTTLRTATGEQLSPVMLNADGGPLLRNRNWAWIAAGGAVAAMVIGILAIGGGGDGTPEPSAASAPKVEPAGDKKDVDTTPVDSLSANPATAKDPDADKKAAAATAAKKAKAELEAKRLAEKAAEESRREQERLAAEQRAKAEADEKAAEADRKAKAKAKAEAKRLADAKRADARKLADARKADARKASADAKRRRAAAKKAEAAKAAKAAKAKRDAAAKAKKDAAKKDGKKRSFDDVKPKILY